MVTKTTRLSLLALLALTYVSCSENLLDGGQAASSSRGRSATVQLKVSTAPEQEANGATRTIDPNETEEGTAPDYKVSDLWLLEYGTDDRLMKDDKDKYVAKYITMEQLTANGGKLGIQLPRAGSADKYKCVMIANTHNDQLFGSGNLSDYETLDNIKKSSKDIKTFKDTYNTTAVSGKKAELYLSYVTDVGADSTSLDCRFYRNVAKLTLKLENADKSGVRITGVQLCNVPDRLSYADRLYDENDKFTLGASLMDFPEDDIVLNANESKELVYYLPRNCQGSDTNIKDARKKNTSSKASSSTCVKVFATDVKTEIPYCYTFYVGENMESDFNVRSNHHYTLPVEISGRGDINIDSRVEDVAPMGANCIMMSLDDNDRDSTYTIYPYKRINKFWSEVGKDKTRIIDENYDWEATIVWQDTNDDVIEFADSKSETFIGKGKRPLKIKLKNPTSTAPCNVLIGVKRKGVTDTDDAKGGYLWSWHLWVTPYKPDRRKPWEDGKYEYTEDVTSGSVFRYAPGTVNEVGNDLWKPGGKYYNKYIMDRHLGATTAEKPTSSHNIKKSGGLLYQFGRKDPFVAEGVTLYKQLYYGNSRSTMKITGKYATSISDGVKWPDWYYVVTGTPKYWDWVEPNPYSDNLWNNPFPSEKEFKDKSFFDPCPEGWRIPLKGVSNICGVGKRWDEMKYSPNAAGPFNEGWNLYIGNTTTVFYPATGFFTERGVMNGANVNGVIWYAEPYNKNIGYYTSWRSGYITLAGHHSTVPRSKGFNIRCIQE